MAEPSSSSSGFSPLKLHDMGEFNPLGMHPVYPVHPVQAAPPTAKNFAFSVSGLWKSNGNLLRWITEVPTKHDEMPFTPASYHSEKRALVREAPATDHTIPYFLCSGCA